jgi:hypothetical protein
MEAVYRLKVAQIFTNKWTTIFGFAKLRLDPRASGTVRPMGKAEHAARKTAGEHSEKRMRMGYSGTFGTMVQVSALLYWGCIHPTSLARSEALIVASHFFKQTDPPSARHCLTRMALSLISRKSSRYVLPSRLPFHYR